MKTEVFILAGGKSSRMGRDKAWLPFGNESLLERIVWRLKTRFSRIAIVRAAGQEIPDTGCSVIEDLLPGRGPIGGLYTALKALEGEKCLIISCDVPFVSAIFLAYLADLPLEGDAIVPQWEGWPQPLQAVYGQPALATVEAQIQAGRFQVRELLSLLKVQVVGEKEIAQFDPMGRTFLNVNTPEAYEEALRLAGEG